MLQSLVRHIRSSVHTLHRKMIDQDELVYRRRMKHLERLQKDHPEEWVAYMEFTDKACKNGMCTLALPTFEEYLDGRPLQLKDETPALLRDVRWHS